MEESGLFMLMLSVATAFLILVPMPLAYEVATGDLLSCYRHGGRIYCCGENGYGQLGTGNYLDSSTPVVVFYECPYRYECPPPGGYKNWYMQHVFMQFDVSDYRTVCGLLAVSPLNIDRRDIFCWGYNGHGEIGDGTTINANCPTRVTGLSAGGPRPRPIQVECGYHHCCALIIDGSVMCWGNNDYGQLGNGTNTQSSVPVGVFGIDNATNISMGSAHSCAVLWNGTVMCWGSNTRGQLGDGTTTSRNIPVLVAGITDAVKVDAFWGGSNWYDGHTCAILTDGTAKCWGHNSNGQLGDGTTADRHTPTTVPGISSAVNLVLGPSVSCFILADRTARCFGVGGYDLGFACGCEGDVNGDYKVNIFDLAAVGRCYGCSLGDSCWTLYNCEDADIKPGPLPDGTYGGDYKINIFDLASVGLNYGRIC